MKTKRADHIQNKTAAALLACVLLAVSGCAGNTPPKTADSFVEEIDDLTEETTKAAGELADDAGTAKSAFDPRDLFEPALPKQDGSAAGAGKSAKSASSAADGASSKTAGKEASAEKEDGMPADPDEVFEVLFLGDSQFAAYRGTGSEIPVLFQNSVDWTDCRVYNMGIPGSCICLGYEQYLEAPENWNSTCLYAMSGVISGRIKPDYLGANYPEVLDTLRSFDPERIDYIVLNYGVNDFLRSSIISADEQNEGRTDVVAEAYRKSLLELRAACPNARIVTCTPLYSEFYDKDGGLIGNGITLENGQGKTLADYVSCLEVFFDTVEDSYLINMFNGEFIDLDMYSTGDYLMDGIHLTERGRRAFADALAGYIGRREGIDPESYEVVKISDY
ncbi:MAG: SGNH/GDSL hydrolase family protein [Lachnospiraceae bacterium]|nr:SGNH/GDSL hydrolase family protein [Lachnospiraceae bacterium]